MRDDAGMIQIDDKHAAFDFGGDAFRAAAHATQPAVTFQATSSGAAIQKTAGVELDVATLGLTTGVPYDAFPEPGCDPDVADCLAALPASQLDTGACGTAS